jgi:hypothetical protein
MPKPKRYAAFSCDAFAKKNLFKELSNILQFACGVSELGPLSYVRQFVPVTRKISISKMRSSGKRAKFENITQWQSLGRIMIWNLHRCFRSKRSGDS